jgi:hypothetical protein
MRLSAVAVSAALSMLASTEAVAAGPGGGSCPGRGGGSGGGSASTQPPAALSPQELADLQYMREEEKLARDVYVVMYEAWGMAIFSNISQSEQHHMDALKGLIDRYGVADPAATTAPGQFVNPVLQQLYDSLVRSGLASRSAAIAAGVLVEETDIADLQEAIAHTSKTDVLQVYGHLLDGSYHHLAAFTQGSR